MNPPRRPAPQRPLSRWRFPLAYLLAAAVFLSLDAVWLTLSAAPIYQPAIGHLMAPEVDWRAAVAFYACYVAGLVFFAVHPALAAGRPAAALLRGACLGFLAYATYDLTNQATLRDWPWRLTLIDLAWGSFASGTASWMAAVGATALTCRPANRASGP